MKLTFLGTGTSQGVPVIACPCEVCTSTDEHDKRLRTSALIHIDDKAFLIDSGPDFRQQMLRQRITHLDAILFTHAHKDHTGGLDDVRAFNYVQKTPMAIYAEELVQQSLRREYSYAFDEHPYPGVPELTLHSITEEPFTIANIKITPIRVMHYQLPILGFRIQNLAYITDANFIAESEKAKLSNLDVLVINALRHEKHLSHFTLAEALAIAEELRPKRCFITHISHQMGKHADIKLPTNIQLAYDGLQINIP